ncbi:unnamed protein product [Acanthoscelides obtectus]|uniref:Glycoside hydrolase family 28 protein n=1 Tax=Acanthoscelides obtectus TaxID=200917 RepID=A0A9P0LWI9_ACAOB|nr:unnamed protein product [Acanthoscelides obtectus]CAK1683215.1 Probable polygalacturonase [Acanthoscelides obtectus]
MMLVLAVIQLIAISAVSAALYDVTKYGADRSGGIPSTDQIARAINDAAIHGAGIVHFPPGKYLTGPIELKSNIILDIADSTIITFLDDPALYPPLDVTLPDGNQRRVEFTPLIRGVGVRNVAIRGNCVLEGNGAIWWDRLPPPATRPIFIYFSGSHNIVLKNIIIRNSPMFNVNIIWSNSIVVDGIRIRNPESYKGAGPNTDGINLLSVNRVHVTNVDVATGDDCLVLDAWGYGKDRDPTHDVLIENSHMSIGHSGVGIGSITAGGLRNITIRNCVFDSVCRGVDIRTNNVRGGVVEDILYQNLTMNNCTWEGISITALFPDYKDKGWHPIGDQTPFIRNIRYENIRGSAEREGIYLVGLPESPVENIVLENVDMRSKKPNPILLQNTRNIVINGRRY